MGLRIKSSRKFKLGHNLATLMAVFALVFQLVSGFVAGQLVSAASSYEYNSTNSLNAQKKTPNQVGKDAPYFNTTVRTTDKISLRLNNPTPHTYCFEYRTDGDTSQVVDTNPVDYPNLEKYLNSCVAPGSNITLPPFSPIEYVEVRLAEGPESDFFFDWTKISYFTYASTNDLNRQSLTPNQVGKAAPHVSLIKSSVGEVELQFVNPLSYRACFEYRIDGVIGKANGPHLTQEVQRPYVFNGAPIKHNVVFGDDIYPQVCLGGNTSKGHNLTHVFQANNDVAVRLALGPERDWDFNWTTFNTQQVPVVTSVTPGEGGIISGTNQRIDIDFENNDVVRAGFLQLNKVPAVGNPANANRTNYPFQRDGDGWYVMVDTTNIVALSGGGLQGDGQYRFKVEAHGFDGVPHGYFGNGSNWNSSEHHFVVDNTAPEVVSATLNGAAANIAPRNKNVGPTDFNLVGAKFTFGLETNDATDTTFVRYRVAKVNSSGGTVAQTYRSNWFNMTSTDGTNWTAAQFDTATVGSVHPNSSGDRITDGTYTIQIETRDSLGNTFDHRYVDLMVDNTAPTALLVSSHPSPLTTDVVTITGSVTDDDIKSHWFEITTPTGRYYEYNMNTTDKEFDFVLDTSDGEGEYRVRYVATDRAGNRNDSVAPEILVLNVTEPAAVAIPPVDEPATPASSQGIPGESPVDNTPTPQLFTIPTLFGFGAPVFNNNDETTQDEPANTGNNSSVLGEQDEEESTTRVLGDEDVVAQTDEGEIQGSLVDDTEVEEGCASFLGLCWYWWAGGALLILTIIGYMIKRSGGNYDDEIPLKRQP